MKKWIAAGVLFVGLFAFGDEPENCKLTVRIINSEEKRTVKVISKSAVSKADCKLKGEEVKQEELKKDDVKSVVVSVGFKEPRP